MTPPSISIRKIVAIVPGTQLCLCLVRSDIPDKLDIICWDIKQYGVGFDVKRRGNICAFLVVVLETGESNGPDLKLRFEQHTPTPMHPSHAICHDFFVQLQWTVLHQSEQFLEVAVIEFATGSKRLITTDMCVSDYYTALNSYHVTIIDGAIQVFVDSQPYQCSYTVIIPHLLCPENESIEFLCRKDSSSTDVYRWPGDETRTIMTILNTTSPFSHHTFLTFEGIGDPLGPDGTPDMPSFNKSYPVIAFWKHPIQSSPHVHFVDEPIIVALDRPSIITAARKIEAGSSCGHSSVVLAWETDVKLFRYHIDEEGTVNLSIHRLEIPASIEHDIVNGIAVDDGWGTVCILQKGVLHSLQYA
ncbi:hypothetical protein C8J56DRAFT_1166969 [Mycena floridula]|nr:hypothetical protein C8J56DRAFT_1166969 [Mycena floridula]